MKRLPSSEPVRWALAAIALLVASIGVALQFGVGFGLILFGLGSAVAVLLYDPERGEVT